MATPRVGQRDKQGRYWTGTGWKSLEQVMKAQQTSPGRTGEKTVLPGVGEIQYTGSKYGWQTKSTVQSRQSAPAKPAPEPAKPAKPAPEPAKPAKPAPENSRPSSSRPASAPPRQPAPESPAVREYMRAAAAARKSGDTAQMAKVRDTGLDIWRKKYAGTLAKNVNPDGTQRGTGQSVMAKQADDLRNLRPATPAPGNEKPGYSGPPTPTGPQAQSALPGGAYSPAATSRMTQRTRNILGVKEQYDAYDLVLEYLLSNGHADTLDEAHYVMMQMDGEYIQSILEDYK